MQLRLMGFAVAAVIGLVGIGFYSMATQSKYVPPDPPPPLDRVMIIILENYHSDRVDPRENGLGRLNPFLDGLATESRLELNYFGVSHPSLPNYIAMIGGDFFGVRDDGESCFNPEHQEHCNGVDAINLVDQLEEADIAWEGLFESSAQRRLLGREISQRSEAVCPEAQSLRLLQEYCVRSGAPRQAQALRSKRAQGRTR